VKKTICNLIFVFLFGSFVFCPDMAVAHGGGGGGDGGGGDGADTFSNSGGNYLMGGGVSWDPNPNGPGIRGSSIYDGRPPNIEKGPYQPGTSVEDAEALLLAGYQSGMYTAEELLEQLEWADRVGITISEAAVQTLDQMAVELQQLLDEIDKQEKKEKDDLKTSSTQNNSTKSKEEKNLSRAEFVFEMVTMELRSEYAQRSKEKEKRLEKARKEREKELEENFLMWIFFGAFRDL